MKKAFHNKCVLIGLILILVIAFCAIAADWISPNDPTKIDMTYRFSQPSSQFPLGADEYGRCILSRLIYGARYSLGLSLLAMSGIILTVVPAGMAATYKGGAAEKVFLWFCDISLALPPTVLVLAVMGIIGSGIQNLIFGAIFCYWGWYGRMVRSYTMTELSKGYVTYAVTGGVPVITVLAKHILPNILPVLLVFIASGIGDIILMISGFSFLGIGLPADIPEWGTMLNEAKSILIKSPQYAIYPGLCVFGAVCAFNLLGEGLRKVFAIKNRRE